MIFKINKNKILTLTKNLKNLFLLIKQNLVYIPLNKKFIVYFFHITKRLKKFILLIKQNYNDRFT